MAEQVIITPTQVRSYFPQLSVNIDDSKLSPTILQAQKNDLEPFLGWYLYNDFIEDYDTGVTFNTAIYQTLYDGESYTYQTKSRYFRGVAELLSHYAIVRIMEISPLSITDAGMTQKLTDESEPVIMPEQRYMMRNIKDDIIRLERDSNDFIRTNISDYPNYTKVYSTSDQKTSFNFYKV